MSFVTLFLVGVHYWLAQHFGSLVHFFFLGVICMCHEFISIIHTRI